MNKAQLLSEYLDRPDHLFECNIENCCHFVCGWVAEVEDSNPMDAFPTPILKAYRGFRRAGMTLSDIYTQYMNRQPIPASFLSMGDVAVLPIRGRVEGVGICAGRTVALLTKQGVLHAPMDYVTQGWRVGC